MGTVTSYVVLSQEGRETSNIPKPELQNVTDIFFDLSTKIVAIAFALGITFGTKVLLRVKHRKN